MAIGTSPWGKETATLPTMKKHRVKPRRNSGQAGQSSSSGSPAVLVPVSKITDHGTRVIELVRTIITKYKEMRKVSGELQRLGTFLYIDKFKFEPALSDAFRWYLHHRLRASLEEEAQLPIPQGRNVILFGSHISVPREAFDLVQQFIAES